jgi:hypothetical protein
VTVQQLKCYRANRYLPLMVGCILATVSGCSSWPWKSGSRDAERLTRVIHAENARLKDIVVQLRSSNEDMAQRSLDDATRIARIEEENEQYRSSIAAFQSERERMARSFQTLQEQVRLALADRTDVRTTSFVGDDVNHASPVSLKSSGSKPLPEAPPEGLIGENGQILELSLEEWFAENSAILREGVEPRLARLGRWLSTRLAHEGTIIFVPDVIDTNGSLGDGANMAVSSDVRSEAGQNLKAIETLRAQRLWSTLESYLPAGTTGRIRIQEDAKARNRIRTGTSSSVLLLPLLGGA